MRIRDEEAEDEPVWPCGARREQAGPSIPPQRFADILVGRPASPAWSRWGQADAGEPSRIAEIGDFKPPDGVAPHISGKLPKRWDTTLGEVAIPLSPQRFLVVGEVERVEGVAALPAVVAGRLRPYVWIGVMCDVAQPRPRGRNRINVERQRAGPQTAPGDSSSETTRATRRTRPRAISSSGF